MRRRPGKPSHFLLVFLALFSILLFYLAERSQKPLKAEYYEEKVAAATLALRAQQLVKEELSRRGFAIDVQNDPNLTGLIGPQYSLITTDRSSLQDKLLSTNPNLAAVVVDMLHRAGLAAGDRVAVFFTGSFPGANIAVLAACQTLGLSPVIISSVGASSFGATWEEFTWLDMENLFVSAGLWPLRSVAASLGGGDDEGRGLSPRGRQLLLEAIKRHGAELITAGEEKSPASALESNIRKRIRMIDRWRGEEPIKAAINVGGGLAAVGSRQNARLIPPGLTTNLRVKEFPTKGALLLLAQRRIPVIHLLDMSRIAEKYQLPLEPTAELEVGRGPVFIQNRYSVASTAIYAAILLVVLAAAVRLDLRYYFLKNRRLLVRKT